MRRRAAGSAACSAFVLLSLACGPESGAPPDEPGPAASSPDEPGSTSSPPPAVRPGSPNARWEIVEQLRRFRDSARHPSDGQGRAWLDWPEGRAPRLEAGGRGRFPLVFETASPGIAPGGRLFLQVSPFWEWSTPQTLEPQAPGYTEVTTTAEGVELVPETLGDQLLAISVGGRGLAAGEQVRIVYGAGPAQARVDWLAERGSPFLIGVDGDGDGIRHFIPDPPRVDIHPGPAARLVLLLPAVARPGDPVSLTAALLDGVGNTGVRAEGDLVLEALPPGLEGPARLPLGPEGRVQVSLRALRSGVYRIRARAPGGFQAESNPMLVAQEAPRILWADLHGHSNFSDGTGLPEDYFRYAREVAGLDVVALTDHDHWGFPFLDEAPDRWRRIQEVTRDFHEPGRFVTLLGYEWTSWIYGHRHVLHFRDEAPLISSIDEETDSPQELWAALGGAPALTFAHHSAGDPVATDWSIPPDPIHEPVTEVASVHGSSEAPDSPSPVRGGLPGNWVRDALGRGYRLGFIGSGDSHDGHPGLVQISGGKGGLAGILSEERTRAGVLAALRGRRTYATNGPRIVLLVRLDGVPMGSVVPRAEEHLLTVKAATTRPLEAVELVSGGRVIEWIAGDGERELAFESAFGPTQPGMALYVRVLEEEGGAAWSSPFFFE